MKEVGMEWHSFWCGFISGIGAIVLLIAALYWGFGLLMAAAFKNG